MIDANPIKLAFGAMKGLIVGIVFLLFWTISGVHLGLWGILIFLGIILFSILQFETSLTTKLPISKIIGIGAVIIFAVLLVNFLVSVDWGKISDSDIFQRKGLQGWEGSGSFKYDYFYLSSGESLTREVEMDGVNVKLFGVETEPSSKSNIVVKIDDLDGHGRSATFRFLVKGDAITLSELSLPCRGVVTESFEAAPVVHNDEIWNYVRAAMRARIVSYAIGKDGRIETYSIPLDGSLQRSERIGYRITVLNEGPSSLKARDIKVVSG